jgi:hypothetical protein
MTRSLSVAPLAGLALGMGAWVISTQFGYTVVTTACGRSFGVVPWIAIACIGLAAIGGLLSWTAWAGRGGPSLREDPEGPQPRRLMAAVSVLAATLFALVIVLQGAAALILSGCQR